MPRAVVFFPSVEVYLLVVRLLLQYADSKKDTLELVSKGSGNPIDELKPLLKEDHAMFGYARIVRLATVSGQAGGPMLNVLTADLCE
jgi:hypothetical protein